MPVQNPLVIHGQASVHLHLGSHARIADPLFTMHMCATVVTLVADSRRPITLPPLNLGLQLQCTGVQLSACNLRMKLHAVHGQSNFEQLGQRHAQDAT